jgi:pilus assembly protein CpaB
MNNITKIVAALLVCAAVLLAALAWWMGTASAPKPAAAPVAANSKKTTDYPVVVALRTLPAGKPIDASAVQVMRLPMNPPGAFSEVSAVAGKVSSANIEEGSPVTERMMTRSLAMQLGKGERAIAVPVDEIAGAGNRVEPGDFVDVFFTLKQGQDVDKTQTRLLASRLRVLSYGASVVGAAASPTPTANDSANNKLSARAAAQSAVLAVPVEDVNRVVLAAQSGRLLLAPRHPEDERTPDVALFPQPAPVLHAKPGLSRDQADELKAAENQAYAGVELASLANNGGAVKMHAVPIAKPHVNNTTSSLEVVRGSKREVVAY